MKLSLKEFTSIKARHGGYAAIVTVSVLAVLIIINLLVQAVPAKWDMTEEKIFSLSDQTRQIISDLDSEIKIYGIFKTGQETTDTHEVLLKYDDASKKVVYKTIDPELNPQLVKQYDENDEGIARGSVIVTDDTNFKVLRYTDLYQIQYNQQGQGQVVGVSIEKAVTSAIQYLKSGFTPKIYELTGHTEFTLADFSVDTLVTKENFEIASVDLLKNDAVPEDATILLIHTPHTDLQPSELDKILDFVKRKGRLYIFTDIPRGPMPVFEELLETLGVSIEPGLVFETSARNQYETNNPFSIIPNYGDHEIAAPIKANAQYTYLSSGNYFMTTALKEAPQKARNIKLTPLLQTSTESWIRTDLTSNTMERIPSDIKGPAILAYAVEEEYKLFDNSPEPFKLVICSSPSLIAAPYPGNIDFFLNGLAWLNDTDDSVSIRAKSLFMFNLRMTQLTAYIIAGVVVILIPLLVGALGLIIWLRRRHL